MTVRLRLVLLALVTVLVASSCSLIERDGQYEIVAYFPRAVALYEQGAVQVLGLPAGEISDIQVVGDQVKMTMAIDDDVPVPEGVKAAIVPQSLIGERRVQLFPPFQEGDPVVSDGHEIAEEDTVIPVEPDEALAALEEFLDSLDPEGLGRLIDNSATALEGQGENLGAALEELSDLVSNVEDNDDDIIAIAERFDDFTSTLLQREEQLAQAIDDFAVVADVLADERDDIGQLITSLADVSGDGLDLVSEHAVQLRSDVEILTRLTRSIDANLDSVQDLLDGTPQLVEGFIDAYNPRVRALDLRNSFDPLVASVLAPLFQDLGLPVPCVDLLSECEDGGLPGLGPLPLQAEGDGSDGAVRADIAPPTTPIDDIVAFIGSPGERAPSGLDRSASGSDADGVVSRLLGTFLGVGS